MNDIVNSFNNRYETFLRVGIQELNTVCILAFNLLNARLFSWHKKMVHICTSGIERVNILTRIDRQLKTQQIMKYKAGHMLLPIPFIAEV